jgi:nucleotide-binding universal stress UspA family protein
MKNNYKILVLSDLKSDVKSILKSSISLAKMIHGDLNFFHVKGATDIVEKDNQLSAIRSINSEYKTINKKIQNLTIPISEEYGISINTKFSFGNVKGEIEKYIKELQPDIIVLGKRKSKPFNFIGDHITDFILKAHSGVIMIASKNNPLAPNKEILLGTLNDLELSKNLVFADNLIENAKKPLKSFKIVENTNALNETQTSTNGKTIEYLFEKNDNSMKNISNYISKNKINLLCVNRDGQNNKNKADIKEIIEKLNVSLLLSSEAQTFNL